MSLSLQLSISEKMNAEFPTAFSLPMFIQFLAATLQVSSFAHRGCSRFPLNRP